jgi:2-keto-4-pentenoate hydratase
MEDLERDHYSVIHKDYFNGNFSLAHALQHTALHLGHLEIMRELWEQLDWNQKG